MDVFSAILDSGQGSVLQERTRQQDDNHQHALHWQFEFANTMAVIDFGLIYFKMDR
jgi:hypothetical protein